jgi:hypothetical protein
MAVIGGIVAGLAIGGVLSVALGNTQSMNTGVPVALAGIAIGLGVGLIVAATIGSEPARRA